MANLLSLAVKIYADATGITEQLTPVEKAFRGLEQEAAKVTDVFKKFGDNSEAAAAAQEKFSIRLQALQESLKAGLTTPEEYAKSFDRLRTAAEEAASDFERASQIIEANVSAEEKAQRAFAESTEELNRLRAQGLLGEEDYMAALERAADTYAKATIKAASYGEETKKAGESAGEATIKFNEITGALGLIPGPLGGIAARLSSLASTAEGVGKLFANPTQAIGSFTSTLSALTTPVGLAVTGIAAIGAAATAVVSGLRSMEAETERLTNTANKLGVSYEFLETLKQSAEMAGIEFGTVNASMTRLLRTLAGADEESKKAANALKAVGLSLDDIQGKGSQEQITLIGEKLKAIEDPAKRAAAATAIFGRAGADLLPVFENIDAGTATLDRFNARLGALDRERVLALGDSFDAVSASLKGFGNELLTPFIGTIQSFADGFASLIAAIGRNVGAVLDFLSPITSAMGLLNNVTNQIAAVVTNLIGVVLEPFAAAGRIVASGIDAISRGFTELFGRVNGAIAGFRDFFKFTEAAEYMNKVFTRLWEIIDRVATIIGTAFTKSVQAIGSFLGSAAESVQTVVSRFLDFVGLSDAVGSVLGYIGGAFGNLWDTIKSVVSGIGGFIERVLKFAEDWLGIKRDIEDPVKATVEIDDGGGIAELLAENKEFQKTLDGITKSVSQAIDESAKFGDAGFNAALKYQTAIDDLKDKLDRGMFNEETFRREAEKAGAAFKEELARIEEDAKLEIQVNQQDSAALAKLQEQINSVADDATRFGQAGFDAAAKFQEKLRDLGAQFEDGRINATTLADETKRATEEYAKQVDELKKAEELQARLLEQQKSRVDQLIKEGDTRTKLEMDLEAVVAERARVEDEQRKAREAGDTKAAEAAAARLAQIDQVNAKLEEQQQATDQGFGQGFAKAFEETNKSIDTLIDKASKLGNAGAAAYQELEASVARLQDQVLAGALSKEQYEKEVAAQRQLFEERLGAAQRVEQFLASQVDARTKAEAEATKQYEERRKQAELNIKAIKDKAAEEEKALEKAREEGRLKDARASKQRLDQLNALAKSEQQIADGKNKGVAGAIESASRQQSVAVSQFQNAAASQIAMASSAMNSVVGQANEALAKTSAAMEKIARQQRAWMTLGPQQVNVADARTAEGQKLILDAAAQYQDPQLIAARQTNSILRQISQGLRENLARIGLPAVI